MSEEKLNLNSSNESANKKVKFDYENSETLLSVNDLKQYFWMQGKPLKAVDGISFDVQKGEVFGIVGESGSGKTTTGRSIVGLYDITGGEIHLEDKLINAGFPEKQDDAKKLSSEGKNDEAKALRADTKKKKKQVKDNRDHLHRSIQMIFQDPVSSLDPRMTVREIISEGLIIQGERDKKLINQKVEDVLNQVGLLVEHADRYPHEFSGGQRQRIGIARAMIMEPEMIIADEPVSALDVSIQAQIINLMNELCEELGITIIFIAHDLAVVKYISDRIAVMFNGKIVEQAESDELFARPLHPYTRSLLSAIPIPDPNTERNRVREAYIPALAHNYSEQGPTLREIFPGHFVYCNDEEEAKYRDEYSEQ